MDEKSNKFLSWLGFRVPFRRPMGTGVDTLVDRVQAADRAALVQLLTTMAAQGDGLSKDQFQTAGHLQEFLDVGHNFCFKDMSTEGGGRIYGFCKVYDSPLCRSESPVVHAGYTLLLPEYRATGVAAEVLSLMTVTGIALGYHGSLVRASLVSAAGIMNAKRLSMGYAVVTGVIPNSTNMGGGRWLEDAIAFGDYLSTPFYVQTRMRPKEIEVSNLPPLRREAVRWFNQHELSGHTFIQYFSRKTPPSLLVGEHVVLQLVDDKDPTKAVLVEDMFRTAAMHGEGFAMDEFNQDGILNRKFLRQSVTLTVLRKLDDQVIGGVVIGQTALAKAANAPSLGGYAVVSEPHRRRGYGKDILAIGERIAIQLGYKNILSDVLVGSKMPGLKLALRSGYYVTGQIPKCAYVKGDGMVDTMVMFKHLTAASL